MGPGAGGHLFVVGDDDQTNYRFRRAYLTNIQDCRQHFENCTGCLLEENYLCTQTILELALQLMQHAPMFFVPNDLTHSSLPSLHR